MCPPGITKNLCSFYFRFFSATSAATAIDRDPKPIVRYWRLADIATAPAFVRYWNNSGQVRASACQTFPPELT
jgi:hypothetical protein